MNSKKQLQHRMVRKKALDSRISKLRQRKVSVGNDDDSSVDSHDNIKNFIAESDVESDIESDAKSDVESESESEKRPSKKARSKKNDEEEESEDESEAKDTDEEEGTNAIRINFGGFGQKDPAERLKPKRYDLTKEPECIKKFVDLITKQAEPSTIDDQIDQFKLLSSDKQKQMIEALERKPNNSEQSILFKILTMNLPVDTQRTVVAKYNSLQNMEPSASEYHKLRSWLEKLTSVPLGIYKDLPAKIEDGPEICNKYMAHAQKCLEDAIYGQEEAKIQILQFIATKMANPAFRGVSLLLAGPPGVGKTSLIKNGIAKALDWPFQFISLGGDSDATTYTGHQVVYEGSHCGKIVNSLVAAKSMSMVLMFDELDKISQTPRGEEVQNLLVHLTDSVQNSEFEDKYLSGIPIDLSKIMFVFSGNDLNKIDKILMDRMIVIKIEGYNTKEKIIIAEKFLIENALAEVNLQGKITFTKDIIKYILDKYASKEAGVREFKRAIEEIVQKINMLRIFNSEKMPFHITDFSLPLTLKENHIDLFLKKKGGEEDLSFLRMYN